MNWNGDGQEGMDLIRQGLGVFKECNRRESLAVMIDGGYRRGVS